MFHQCHTRVLSTIRRTLYALLHMSIACQQAFDSEGTTVITGALRFARTRPFVHQSRRSTIGAYVLSYTIGPCGKLRKPCAYKACNWLCLCLVYPHAAHVTAHGIEWRLLTRQRSHWTGYLRRCVVRAARCAANPASCRYVRKQFVLWGYSVVRDSRP